MNTFTLAIHGGAGTITRQQMSLENEKRYLAELEKALETGRKILAANGSALDAVEAAVVCLENCELFNAGKGSVFNKEGRHEMDASLMTGENLMAGAVSGVRNIKNPIKLARSIMQNSDHVYLSYPGAEDFARLHHLEFEAEDYFFNQFRYNQLQEIRDTDIYQLDHSEEIPKEIKESHKDYPDKKFGTVGAVALDRSGNL